MSTAVQMEDLEHEDREAIDELAERYGSLQIGIDAVQDWEGVPVVWRTDEGEGVAAEVYEGSVYLRARALAYRRANGTATGMVALFDWSAGLGHVERLEVAEWARRLGATRDDDTWAWETVEEPPSVTWPSHLRSRDVGMERVPPVAAAALDAALSARFGS